MSRIYGMDETSRITPYRVIQPENPVYPVILSIILLHKSENGAKFVILLLEQ